ncbi:MAG: LysM peptidoglycan-binding domain-containing protein [Paludibacteraceae bacterium]
MRKIITTTLLISLVCFGCKSKSLIQANTSSSKEKTEYVPNTLTFQDSLINYGKKYLKVPYRYGGTTAKGFDCSGFTSHVYRNFGYNLQRASKDQAQQFPSVKKKDLQTGDLVFFEGRRHNGNVGHVGIVTETKSNGQFRFIHASVRQGVTVSSSTEAYYASRYLKAGRVKDNASATLFASNVAKNTSSLVNANKTTTNQNISDNLYHTVAKGDNLSSISKKYDVPISTIQQLNNLTSKRIKRGQKLLIAQAVHIPEMAIAKANAVDVSSSATSKVVTNLKVNTDFSTSQKSKIETSDLKSPNFSINPNRSYSAQTKTIEPTIQSTSTEMKFTHKVKSGESLYAIARKYNMTVDKLKAVNNLSSNSISAGKTLRVESSNVVNQSEVSSNNATKPSETLYHTVKQGDTLYSIARLYGCTVNNLRELNPELSNTINIGDRVKVKNQ